ncbi:MAG: permease [Nocardioidaceae bacterium]
MGVLNIIGSSVTEGFFMFWATLWALVLGFTLSGAVQAFVSRDEMQKAMGDHRPRTVVRTSLLGAASSSCSYAASALAKSLFQRGADFTTSMVFMFASTNLVLELGIVLWLLIGWQFALAEFVGGAIMIALFVLLAPRIFPADELAAARERLAHSAAGGAGGHQGHGDAGSVEAQQARPFRERLRSRAGWADAAGYTVSDLMMLRRELVIGYLVAGFLAVAVPASVFSTVFLSGHGLLTDLENAVVGPFIAFISFVCSIGNVPLAAALYEGGISFGGTVAFIFADLIALPLVVIYGKFYGRRLALRLFLSFWAVMSTAGLLVDLLFRVVGIDFPQRRFEIAMTHFEWNYTTFLNIAFLVVAGAVYWTYRNRERLGSGGQYAKDPVCGMQVERANAPAATALEDATYYFCSDRCHDRFVKDPGRFARTGEQEPTTATGHERSTPDSSSAGAEATDPVCGMTVDVASPASTATVGGRRYLFCSPGCAQQFTSNPGRYGHPSAATPEDAPANPPRT